MSSETKVCPFCAEEIKAEAVVCRYCHQPLTGNAPNAVPAPPAAKKPWLGLVGFLVMGMGFCVAFASLDLGLIVFVIGVIILAVTLVTGNLTFLGR